MDTASDEEDTSGLSKSAKGQILGGKLTLGDISASAVHIFCAGVQKYTQEYAIFPFNNWKKCDKI